MMDFIMKRINKYNENLVKYDQVYKQFGKYIPSKNKLPEQFEK